MIGENVGGEENIIEEWRNSEKHSEWERQKKRSLGEKKLGETEQEDTFN